MGRASAAFLAFNDRERALREQDAREAIAELLNALRLAHGALAMMVSPSKIVVTTVAGAWANAVEAEAVARAAIAKAEGR